MNEKQVDKGHYDFERYCYPERWDSYYHQIQEILAVRPESVLEVGAGDETTKRYVTRALGCSYKTLDLAEDLSPDIVGSILDIPLADRSVDVSCVFEVLEHIPFEKVPEALSELKRVSRRFIFISVPHFGPMVDLSIKIPFLPRIGFFFKIPFPKKHVWNGQHYWELGKKGFSPRAFKKLLESYGEVVKEYVPREAPYHHFFVIRLHP
ncbi:MAG: class I SAM-dependent methyltransferase [Candidatus Taylorbacteria bacterium]|nr:class I SAM-dependent methyltransferase [Candidatus Taylorbacteria bacterium]